MDRRRAYHVFRLRRQMAFYLYKAISSLSNGSTPRYSLNLLVLSSFLPVQMPM